jgi:hypothetical protein
VNTLKATVVNGRLVMEEPTKLPDGTVVHLAIADDGDDLDEEERAALHAALAAAWQSARDGDLQPAEQLVQELQERR